MSARQITVTSDEMSISRLCWDLYHSTTPGAVERVLTLNPGLSALGPFIPVGTKVTVDIAPPEATQPRRVIRLWD